VKKARNTTVKPILISTMKPTLTLLTVLLLEPLAALPAAEPVGIDLATRTWQGIPGL